MITQRKLKEFVSYDKDTGIFIWKKSTNGRIRVGSEAGSLENNGYIRISIMGVRYLAHRLAMIYMTGSCGKEIDHIDGCRSNNSIVNLRCVTRSINCQNQKLRSSNTSGVLGVSFNVKNNKWITTICVNGKSIYLGLFSCFDEAVLVRKNAEKKYKFHENHGRIATCQS